MYCILWTQLIETWPLQSSTKGEQWEEITWWWAVCNISTSSFPFFQSFILLPEVDPFSAETTLVHLKPCENVLDWSLTCQLCPNIKDPFCNPTSVTTVRWSVCQSLYILLLYCSTRVPAATSLHDFKASSLCLLNLETSTGCL